MREHLAVFDSLGAETRLVRRASDLLGLDGLVLPGGESTVIDKLARNFGLAEPLREAISDGLPVYGTCAGLILVADRLSNGVAGQQTFGGLHAVVRRNAFGSQTDSFEADLEVPALGPEPVRAVFIRAPVIEEAGADVTALAALADGRIVAARQGGILVTSFHPEVTGERRFHEYFLRMVAGSA